MPNPTGLLLAPLAMMVVVYTGKKNKKSAPYVMMLVVLVVLPLTVGLACGGGTPAPEPSSTPVPSVPPPATPTLGGETDTGDGTSTSTPPVNPPVVPCVPTETPTSTPLPTGYNRQTAVDFALKYKNIAKFIEDGYAVPDPENDCTNFISHVLQAGGLKQTDSWNPEQYAWKTTVDLFNYLTSPAIGFTQNSYPFWNTPDAALGGDNNLQLRANNLYTREKVNQVKNLWTEFIANNQDIQPGDLVFYYNPTWYGDTWTHVGIVTGRGGETTWSSKIQNGIQEPLIVDHSGPEEIKPDNLPRSVGDTNSTYNRTVVFLRAP